MTRNLLIAAVLLGAGCSDDGTTPDVDAAVAVDAAPADRGADQTIDAAPPDAATTDAATTDTATTDVAPDATAPDATPPDAGAKGLPFTYTRPSVGKAVTQKELEQITDKYIALLKDTRYFDLLDERVHGWPQSDPKKQYWYGTFWSGVTVVKKGGKVTYLHDKDGADNNGLRTGPVLEGTCYAAKLWGTSKLEALTRRLIRGLNSWILAMERYASDPTAGSIMTRASYPKSITSTDGGRTIYIDYSLNHPGQDNGACEYVHLPKNPHWGDIYVKNKRSKDCIGHMLRAIATLTDCSDVLSKDAAKDLAAMKANYVKWAKQVEKDKWTIATWNKQAKLWLPPDTLAHFITLGNGECNAVLSLSLYANGSPGSFKCGNGIHPLEWIVLQNDHNGEIVRSFHEAAVKMALETKQNTVAKTMLAGLAKRLEGGLTIAKSGKWPSHINERYLADLILHSAATGVPLTWTEVRYIHQQITKAHTQYTKLPKKWYRVFDKASPDGTYPYKPYAAALSFRSLGLALGTCVASFRNPASKPVLDCARLKKTWTP